MLKKVKTEFLIVILFIMTFTIVVQTVRIYYYKFKYERIFKDYNDHLRKENTLPI